MRIVIAGGHGQIALLLSRQLADAGHHGVGLIRNPDHGDEVRAAGAESVVIDLENASVSDVAAVLRGADAAVFAAGSGPDSGPDRTLTVDRDGAILLADAAVAAGVRRLVVISSMGADESVATSDDTFQIYLRAKGEADAAIRERDLDWTIIRPGGLTDDAATGRVTLGTSLGRGTIPRADVAALVASAIADGTGISSQFEAISGEAAVADALRTL